MSLAMAVIGLGVVSMAVQASAVRAQGQAEQAQAEVNAQAAEHDAQVAEEEAKIERQQAAWDISTMRREGASVLASQRARISAAGLALSGSPLDVLTDTAFAVERDVAAARYGGEVKAWSRETQADMYRWQGGTYRWQGDMAARSSRIGMAGTIMTGLGSTLATGYHMGLWS